LCAISFAGARDAIAHGVYLENRGIETMDVSDYPDFSSHGYQVTKELGCNQEGGRITYLATAQNLDQQVVIKEFRFALTGANWSGFKAYQREIEMLQQLAHPRIPRYLDSFETQVGFCLVQEYKNALSLAVRRSFTAEQIKRIGVSVLEILVYLQQRTPPVIHRDIKPENILVDKQLNAYLVDFGFARIRGGELALSSVAAGTPGFMPPEEQFGRPLTEASDLYSLGATLICLLTGTRSVDIGTLIDDDYRFDFKKLVPKLNPRFISWLEKMVAPNVKQRFDNATVALESLNWERFVDSPNCVESLESLVGVVKGRELTNVLALPILSVVAGVRRIFIVPRLDSQLEQLLNTKRSPGCNFQDANLKGANLKGADLKGANLEGADLKGANLKGANLKDANLWGANLWGANLKGANLKGANFWGANLEGANLKGAKLESVKLENANLKGAIMPDGKKHP
jgi:serine/threonine protein kinase